MFSLQRGAYHTIAQEPEVIQLHVLEIPCTIAKRVRHLQFIRKILQHLVAIAVIQ